MWTSVERLNLSRNQLSAGSENKLRNYNYSSEILTGTLTDPGPLVLDPTYGGLFNPQ